MRSRSLAVLLAVLGSATALAGCGGGGGSSFPSIGAAKQLGLTPPPGTVVDAREWGSRDLAIARKGPVTTVQVVGPQGGAVNGLHVSLNGRAARVCGPGCYRATTGTGPVTVRSGGRTWRFDLPATAPSGAARVAAAQRAYAKLKTVSLWQKLGSSPTVFSVARFLFVAPDRLRYEIQGGSQAIVVGGRRWDRVTAADTWTESSQTRVDVMHVPWRSATRAHVVAPGVVTFYDPGTRAWFRVTLQPGTSLPTTVLMTGVSHFMIDRFSGFDAPATIVPPTK
jgi:hypothetical protein